MTNAEKIAILERANEATAFGEHVRPHRRAGFWTKAPIDRVDGEERYEELYEAQLRLDEHDVLKTLETAEAILGCRVSGELAVMLFGLLVYGVRGCGEHTRAWKALERLGRNPRQPATQMAWRPRSF